MPQRRGSCPQRQAARHIVQAVRRWRSPSVFVDCDGAGKRRKGDRLPHTSCRGGAAEFGEFFVGAFLVRSIFGCGPLDW
jgi:hypothetical protein